MPKSQNTKSSSTDGISSNVFSTEGSLICSVHKEDRTCDISSFPSILTYLYSKHRRLQILSRSENPDGRNTPVIWEANQVEPGSLSAENWSHTCSIKKSQLLEPIQIIFSSYRTTGLFGFFSQLFRLNRHCSVNAQNLSYNSICIAILQYYLDQLSFLSRTSTVASLNHN